MIANIDSLNTFARIAVKNSYVKPIMDESNIINIKDGRHPVIENNLNENEFIANDSLKEQGNGLDTDTQFKTLYYDLFSKELSEKVRSSIRQIKSQGKNCSFDGGRP